MESNKEPVLSEDEERISRPNLNLMIRNSNMDSKAAKDTRYLLGGVHLWCPICGSKSLTFEGDCKFLDGITGYSYTCNLCSRFVTVFDPPAPKE